jgi:hypothetical protein
MKLRVRIDRLVIADGLIAEHAVEELQHRLQAELGRLLATDAGRLSIGRGRTIASLSSSVAVPAGDVRSFGVGIAACIHGALL